LTGPQRYREPKNPLSLHDRALGLLAVRARSRRELQTRLSRAGFDPEQVEAELERLASVGLIDDEAFARQFVEHAVTSRLAGRRAVATSLAAKGVDRGTVELVLEEIGGDDVSRAAELAATRAGRLACLPPEVAFRRLLSVLLRRGYEPSVARKAASDALGLASAAGSEGPPEP